MASTSLSQRANSANSVRVHGHYYRSVNLQRDYQASPSLEHYLITPTVARLSRRIVQALATPNGNRTWSITGPYGTGKSAFALFLSKLLARELEHPEAESFIAGFDRTGLNGLFPVLIVGQRRNLKVALLESLAAHTKAQLPKLYQTIRAELDRATQGDALPSDDAVLHCYEQAHEALQMQGFAGLMVIIDEFGKFLEHTAEHNDDLLILQSLAEFASRSAAPFGLITILHTAFGHYLTDVSDERQRAEWQKVQGRFQDVAFQEPPEQLLWLVSDALQTAFEPDVAKAYNDRLSRALQSKALEEAAQRFPLGDLLPECVPLSPLTTLLLYPLFRSKLAQNERSLFAFLTSVEPFSVQAWLTGLQSRDWQHAPLYGLPELYDYISTSLGTGLYQGDSSRRWVEIADALDRLGADAPSQSSRVIKSIGLLWMYGATVGLRASEDALLLALADLKEDRAEVQEALAYLERRSIVVYRRFDQAYALWEGSDIDLGSHYEAARRSLQQGNLAERLGKLVDLRSVVARAHYITTGTLRYFRPQLVDGTEATLDAVFSHPFALGEEDGRITFVLSQDDSERERLIRYAQTLAEQQDADTTIKRHILAFPKPISGLEEQLKQLEAWRYVEANTPALSGDRVARRELQANVVHAQNRLEATAGSVLGLRGYRFDPGASDWLHAGESVTFASAVAFQRWLSSLCDALYHAAPPLHNELLNREKHSSSAKAALNKLVKAMLNAPEQYRFGVSGTPAEVSMYEAFFRQSGAHLPLGPHADDSPGDGPWRITAPSEPQWQPLWQAVQDFLTESQHERKPVTELYQQLHQPFRCCA